MKKLYKETETKNEGFHICNWSGWDYPLCWPGGQKINSLMNCVSAFLKLATSMASKWEAPPTRQPIPKQLLRHREDSALWLQVFNSQPKGSGFGFYSLEEKAWMLLSDIQMQRESLGIQWKHLLKNDIVKSAIILHHCRWCFVCVCVSLCVRACICASVFVWVFVRGCMHAYICACVRACVCVCVCACVSQRAAFRFLQAAERDGSWNKQSSINRSGRLHRATGSELQARHH